MNVTKLLNGKVLWLKVFLKNNLPGRVPITQIIVVEFGHTVLKY